MSTGKPTGSRRIAYSLSELGAFASVRFAAKASELGLTASEAAVLRIVSRFPGLSQRALAERINTPASRMVAIIDSLVNRELVERQRSVNDRRNYELILTRRGQTIHTRLRHLSREHEDALVKPLTEQERDQLATLLKKLIAAHELSSELHILSQ